MDTNPDESGHELTLIFIMTEIIEKELVYKIVDCGKKVGLIINFKHPKLGWERLVL